MDQLISALMRKDSELNHVVAALPGGVATYRVQANGSLESIYYSDGVPEITGHTKQEYEQLISKDAVDIVYEADRQNLVTQIQQCFRTGKKIEITYRVKHKKGYPVWVRAYGNFSDPEDVSSFFHVIFINVDSEVYKDVNARINYEKELQYLEELHGDTMLRKCRISISADAVLNFSASERMICSKTDGQFSHLLEDLCQVCINPHDAESLRRMLSVYALKQRYLSGNTVTSYVYQIQMLHEPPCYVRTQVKMFTGVSKGDIMAFIYTLDVNAEIIKRQIDSLLIDSSYEFLGLIDTKKRTLQFYRGALEGLPFAVNDVIAYDEFIHTFISQCILSSERSIAESELDLCYILEKLSKEKHYSCSQTTVRFSHSQRKKWDFAYLDQQHDKLLVTCTDITEIFQENLQHAAQLRNALEAAQKASQAKSSFLAQMSHDIRTPLNAILATAELVKMEQCNPEITKKMQTIITSGGFLLSLINDILDISKSEHNKMVLHPSACRKEQFLQDLQTTVVPIMEEKQIQFTLDLNIRVDTLYVDGTRLNQLFFNLLSNAAKYTPQNGRVSFCSSTLRIQNDILWARYIVQDNGIGMSEAFQQHAFEPFTREQEDYDFQWQGTGLGLSIVKKIVDAMQGTIRLESSLDKGTTFYVDLPLKIYHAPEAAQASALPQSPDFSVLQGKQILLAEDNSINRRIAIQLLSHMGLTVESVANGLDAVKLFSQSAPGYFQAVLMDIRMPVMNGLTAAKNIRSLNRPDAATIPILAMTANAFPSDREQSAQAGMNAHLTKPIDPELLYRTLCAWICNNNP